MKIQDLNFGTKLLTCNNGEKIKIFRENNLLGATKYIHYTENHSRFNYDKDKKLVEFSVRKDNFLIDSNGFLIYTNRQGLIYSCNIVDDSKNTFDIHYIPNTVINKAEKLYKSLTVAAV